MLAALLGLTACVTTSTDGACEGARPYAWQTETALLQNEADVPSDVGEAATDLLIWLRSYCSW